MTTVLKSTRPRSAAPRTPQTGIWSRKPNGTPRSTVIRNTVAASAIAKPTGPLTRKHRSEPTHYEFACPAYRRAQAGLYGPVRMRLWPRLDECGLAGTATPTATPALELLPAKQSSPVPIDDSPACAQDGCPGLPH